MTAISVLYRYKEYMTSVMLYRSKENFLHARHWAAQNFHHVTLWIEAGGMSWGYKTHVPQGTLILN